MVTPKMLVLGSHRAQISNNARTVMEQECNTTVITIGGLTPVHQHLDVLISKPFKTRVDDLFNEHLTANLDANLTGTVQAKRRRVLMTKWVGQAWQEVSASLQEQIKAVSKSIGISIPAAGSEDNLMKFRGLPEYRIARVGAAADEQDVEERHFLPPALIHSFTFSLLFFLPYRSLSHSLSCCISLSLSLSFMPHILDLRV